MQRPNHTVSIVYGHLQMHVTTAEPTGADETAHAVNEFLRLNMGLDAQFDAERHRVSIHDCEEDHKDDGKKK